MGIQGLIPFLEKASKPTNVSEFSGGTAVIDAYCWLHKGVFSCAEKIVLGENCDLYVSYCMKFINMFLAKNVKPILVFDGQKLPAKMGTEEKRRETREQNRKKAAELMRMDRSKEAQTYLRRCVDVTHEMALNLIQACRSRNVDCIVAPYEADAQLAFLNMQNLADVIVTEDSDLLLFGAKKVLFKMDVNGNGLLIEQNKLYLAMGMKLEEFSLDKFRYMCILSGCDYLPSLPGIGLVKACRFVKRTADPDIFRALTRLSLHLNMPQLCVTQDYRDKFMEADFMFKYQPVYDPRKRLLRPLTDLDSENDNYYKYKSLIEANNLSTEQIKNLSYGNLDPFKYTKLDDWSPSKNVESTCLANGREAPRKSSLSPYPSIWSENYKPNSWTKPKVKPPNALCPASCEIQRTNELRAGLIHSRRLQPVKRKILPRAALSYDQKRLENPHVSSIINVTDEEIRDKIDDICSETNNSPRVSPSTNQFKKIHHNPFLRSGHSNSATKMNVSMLNKLQQVCCKVEQADDNLEMDTRSGYFKRVSDVSPKESQISDNHLSPPTSPIIVGGFSRAKFSLVSKNDVHSQRSPLKTLNVSGDCHDDSGSVLKKYFLPDDEKRSPQRGRDLEKEIVGDRHRKTEDMLSAAMNVEKKSSGSEFRNKLKVFKRGSETSSFSWASRNGCERPNLLNITTSAAVGLNFKKLESTILQPLDEDEGFHSPNNILDNTSFDSEPHFISARKPDVEYESTHYPPTKLIRTHCRTPGLRKGGQKQLSLDQYAFKSVAKMRR